MENRYVGILQCWYLTVVYYDGISCCYFISYRRRASVLILCSCVQQVVFVSDTQQRPTDVQHVQSFGRQFVFACVVFCFCNPLIGLIAFMLTGALHQRYRLKRENQPECQICHSPPTVKHILIHCTCFGAARQRYLGVDTIKELF